jgi:hypothetical protein
MKFNILSSATVVVGGFSLLASAAPAPSSASAANPTASDPAAVYKAQATALTLSPTSNVKGKSFDRYVQIWFENTDYDMAAADRELPLPQALVDPVLTSVQPTSNTLPRKVSPFRTSLLSPTLRNPTIWQQLAGMFPT